VRAKASEALLVNDRQPFSDILVGVDDEGLCAHAVMRAMQLAQDLDAKLHLIHGVEVPPPLYPNLSEQQLATWHAGALERSRKRAIESLGAALEQAGLATDLEELVRAYPGHAAKVILRHAESEGIGMIVLGHHERRALFDFGSTARVVLARSEVPVWTQTEPVAFIERILVPVDFSEHSQRALDHAHALAQRLGAKLTVLHCYTPSAFANAYVPGVSPVANDGVDKERMALQRELRRLMDAYEWHTVESESRFEEGTPVETILDQAREHDLVVMGTHGRSGLSRFVLGNVAYSVLRQSQRPVLTVPNAGRTWLLDERRDQAAAVSQID